jgi:glycerol-3-phosphate dehydrogenase
VRADCVVNAAGAWVEALRKLEDAAAPPLLHLSKGVHIGIPASRLPVRNLLLLATDDKRSIFALRRDRIVFLGTTDTTYARGADLWPVITRADVEYLLEPLRRYLSVEKLEVSDVRTSWAGLRPLVAEPGKAPAETSRKDEILIGRAGVITIAGGKLTGYRPTALRTLERVERVGRALPVARGPPLPAVTQATVPRAHGARPPDEVGDDRARTSSRTSAARRAAAAAAPAIAGEVMVMNRRCHRRACSIAARVRRSTGRRAPLHRRAGRRAHGRAARLNEGQAASSSNARAVRRISTSRTET